MESAIYPCGLNVHKKSWLVNAPVSLGKSMCFLLVCFVNWGRRTKSSEEQQALSSFWSSEQTVSNKLQVGEVMTWWFDVDSNKPKEEHSLCL